MRAGEGVMSWNTLMGGAAQELNDILAQFDPKTDPSSRLSRSVRALLAMAEGGPEPDDLIT